MPYNTWNTGGYQPNWMNTPGYPYYPQNSFQPSTMQTQQPQPAPQPQIQIQNGGFVRVQNENEARMYPVAPGNSVTFIDEGSPYCYVKTMGFSQLDTPKFEKYRLVKEEVTEEVVQQTVQNSVQNHPSEEMVAIGVLRGDIDALRADLDRLKGEIEKPSEAASKANTAVKRKGSEVDG